MIQQMKSHKVKYVLIRKYKTLSYPFDWLDPISNNTLPMTGNLCQIVLNSTERESSKTGGSFVFGQRSD